MNTSSTTPERDALRAGILADLDRLAEYLGDRCPEDIAAFRRKAATATDGEYLTAVRRVIDIIVADLDEEAEQ